MTPATTYEQLGIDIHVLRDRKAGNDEKSPITSDQVSPASRDRLLQFNRVGRCSSLSARCVNGIVFTGATLCQSGALIGVALLTAADLTDWQKGVAGGLTVALIGLSTFCFWKLSFCPEKNEVMVPVSSYSGLQTLSLSNRRLVSDPDNTDAESEPEQIHNQSKIIAASATHAV